MHSNGEWGRANQAPAPADDHGHQERWHQWNQWNDPAEGDIPDALKEFLASRDLTPLSLRATGGRWYVEHGKAVLGYIFNDAIKHRTLAVPPRRWTSPTGATWTTLKVMPPRGDEAPKGVLVVEGETDAAWCWEHYPEYAVACLPAGALTFTKAMAYQVAALGVPVLVALDNDQAGDQGAQTIMDAIPSALRLRPPGGHNDWCAYGVAGASADPIDPLEAAERPPRSVFSLRDVFEADLGTYEENNWFDQDVLPKGGSCIIHAPQKSLKSVILLDMIRALATGTEFTRGEGVGYDYVAGSPARVLLFQMEIRPEGFQRRVRGWVEQMPDGELDAYLDNAFVHKIVDGELPRLKVGSQEFRTTVLRAIDQSQADVVAFDPLQRLTGSADLNQANELEALLDFFAELQNAGITVLACHHNNKASGASAKGAHAMTGSQRFAADADSICSVWHDDECGPDDNPDRIKRRNFTWTLRNGAALGRSITVRPSQNTELMTVQFGPLITSEVTAIDDGDPSIV